MKKKITLTCEKYEKDNKKWILKSTETEEVSEAHYTRTIADETLRFFRSIGGYERLFRSYTEYGYLVSRVVSISPNRNCKIVRVFEFSKITE